MNEKFFSLPEEKQQAILNAGYHVFAQNSYKKSPMSEIADAAGISKSLLFHYFHNKRELYLFLWEKCEHITLESLAQHACYEQDDLFEIMRSGLRAKAEIMRRYPDLTGFVLKAYYEKDPAVCEDIRRSCEKYVSYSGNAQLLKLVPARFAPGLDLEMMFQSMYWASVGYIWEKLQQGDADVDGMERDFDRMIDFWRSAYLRKEGQHEGDTDGALD